jgi:hypothetical protein
MARIKDTTRKRGGSRDHDGQQALHGDDSGIPVERLACPFAKRHPYQYCGFEACARASWPSIARLKEHLFRRHAPQPRCPRCLDTFPSEEELETHTRLKPCNLREGKESKDRMSTLQQHAIKSRRKYGKRSNAERWAHIFSILFPGYNPVPEPWFLEIDPLDQLKQGFQQKLVDRIERSISQDPALNHDMEKLQRMLQHVEAALNTTIEEYKPNDPAASLSANPASQSLLRNNFDNDSLINELPASYQVNASSWSSSPDKLLDWLDFGHDPFPFLGTASESTTVASPLADSSELSPRTPGLISQSFEDFVSNLISNTLMDEMRVVQKQSFFDKPSEAVSASVSQMATMPSGLDTPLKFANTNEITKNPPEQHPNRVPLAVSSKQPPDSPSQWRSASGT